MKEQAVFRSLSPGTIGIRDISLPRAVELAQAGGFEGLDFDIREAADLVAVQGTAYLEDLFLTAGLRFGAWGLPLSWRQDDRWEADLRRLPRLAAVGREVG